MIYSVQEVINNTNSGLDTIEVSSEYLSSYLITEMREMSASDYRYISNLWHIPYTQLEAPTAFYTLKLTANGSAVRLFFNIGSLSVDIGNVSYKKHLGEYSICCPIGFINRQTFNSITDMYYIKPISLFKALNYIDKIFLVLKGVSLFNEQTHRFNSENNIIFENFHFVHRPCLIIKKDKSKILDYRFYLYNSAKNSQYIGPETTAKTRAFLEDYMSTKYSEPYFSKKFNKLTKKEFETLSMMTI